MIGSKVAHFEITALLGSGGMGDVYQATDTKLGRSVAIKVLPEAFTHDADRLARFEREARVLASLNHSNIAAIHGLEESGGRSLLVMELVEGETLADRISRGPIPVDEALPIAKQICEALEAAHEKGIIHRDLKPANIKITPDAKVKVLDFGLAKAFEGESTNANLSKSPTLSMAATNAGLILGTAAYMSPEQAKGRTVDRRTDIFAFGCVLYEMLTGQPTFDGEDVGEILARVIEREPDWSKLPAKIPPRIQELLRRCLEKDPKKRKQSAGDVRIDIELALTEPGVAVSTNAPARNSRLAWILAFAAAALVAAVLIVPAVRHLRETPPPSPPETRTDIVTPATTQPFSFALSPDGRQFVFVASGDGASRLWLRPLDKRAAQPLTGTEGASFPFWSPDSRSIGFFADRKMKRIDIAGGSPQTLTDAYNSGGTWSPDGLILFAQNGNGPLFRISVSGGAAVAVTKLEKQTAHRFPQFLPGGRQFLFYAQGTPETQGIYLGSLDAAETKRLTAADAAGVYAPSGWLLFIRGGTLLAQRLDLSRHELTGDSVTVADPVAFDSLSFAGATSVSATGLMAYRVGGTNRRQLTWFDRSGKVLGAFGDPGGGDLVQLSPDGRRVAVHRTVQGSVDIWLLDSTRATRFTLDASIDRFPIWSSDGSRIVFQSNRKGTFDLYQKPSSGGGSEELLVDSPQIKNPNDSSSDGRFLLYHSQDSQTERDLWVLPMERDRTPFVFLKTGFDERSSQFSPDGRWVAYTSNESGRYEINVRPFRGRSSLGAADHDAGGQWQVSTAGGIYPRWRPDGKELYYVAPDGKLMAAPITVNGATIDPGSPVALFETHIVGGGADNGQGWQYDVSRDGRFLINVDDAASPITLIQNWKPPSN
jgi:eukaryotic-like serine/threonine-protein kinase